MWVQSLICPQGGAVASHLHKSLQHFLFPFTLIYRPCCSKPNPPLASHSLRSTSPHFNSLLLFLLSALRLSFSLPLPVHLSVRFCVNPPTLCNLALRSLLTLNCSRSFQNDDCQACLWLSMAVLFKRHKKCKCVCVCLHACAGWLAAFDCKWGDYGRAHYVRPQHV